MSTHAALYKETLALATLNIDQIRQNLRILGVGNDSQLEAIFQRVIGVQSELQGHIKLLIDKPFLLSMPDDCLKIVFRSLSIENVFRCALVCKSLNQKMKTEDICGDIYFHHFPKHPKPKSLSSYEACKRATCRNQLEDACSTTIPTSIFGACKFIVCQGNIFRCAHGSGICVHDLNTKLLLNSVSHQEGIRSFAHSGSEVYTANGRLICAWNAKTGEYLSDFNREGENGNPYPLCVSGRALYSGHDGGRIVVWDLDSKKQLHNFQASQFSISFLLAFEKKLYSGDKDGTITIWDVEEPERPISLGVLSEDKSEVHSLAAFQKVLCSSHMNGNLKFWDLDTGGCLYTFDEKKASPLIVFNERLYSTSIGSGYIKVWDETGSCLQTVKQDDLALDLVASERNLFSSYLGGVKKWGFTSEYLSLIELANLFRDEKDESIQEAMLQFSNLPQKVKSEIYGKLYFILRPFQNDYLGCGEHAFHGQYGQSSTQEQRAQAIENYAAREL